MIRIAVTGPESTGKSTLAEQLAKQYDTVWIPEYAREYLNTLDRPYTFEDVEQIALTQMHREDQSLVNANNFLISDTELLVIKIWMEHKYNSIPSWLEHKIMERKYDLYLLCDIDIPWEFDTQREHPDLREHFFQLYESELKARNFTYRIISGDTETRLQSSVQAINNLNVY